MPLSAALISGIAFTALPQFLYLQLNNVYMGRLEENFLYKTGWSNSLIIWVRFIDDIFIIWKGDKDNLIKFIDHLNNVVPSNLHKKSPPIQSIYLTLQA